MITLRKNEILYLDLGNGMFKALKYEDIIKKRATRKISVKGSILRRIRLYKYAEENGKFVSGAAATTRGLVKSKKKILDLIFEQPKEMQEELLDLF